MGHSSSTLRRKREVRTTSGHPVSYFRRVGYQLRALPNGMVGVAVGDRLHRFTNLLAMHPPFAPYNDALLKPPPGQMLSEMGDHDLANNAPHQDHFTFSWERASEQQQHSATEVAANGGFEANRHGYPNKLEEKMPETSDPECTKLGMTCEEASRCAEATERDVETKNMLRTTGICPMGFDWIRHPDGWRCWGGNHFVFDNQQLADKFIGWLKTLR